MAELLVCGATGHLGGRIAARLAARGVPFRALVRASSDTADLVAHGADLVRGDLTDPAGLPPALAGVRTVVTTANAVGRWRPGARDVSIARVDRDGHAALVRAAEAAGVERFVFVSALTGDDAAADLVPLFAAKRATEELLRRSALRPVVVRPAAFQEVWLSPATGIRPDRRRAVVLGRGRNPVPYVAQDDVAEACVRLATMADPPGSVDLGGPEPLTRHEVVDAFERAVGARFRRVVVPRPVLAAGARALRRRLPELATGLGIAVSMDVSSFPGPEALHALGIRPRPASEHITVTASRAAGG
ncbi:Nucleoside-diphosphate-sugar epimerase [Geodermatophilus dictyosporus]|uniref:Nucleoside-diphosphate-sugar epimerase n=1 Tax=Geodermatophilus dictyosporus TaxID=1523247 RepID=A0A1I5K0M5_9ACTN|nr:NAD(P)H-binding protein [Geodermatophilus dictyosporus]SFO78540.1 Nucleoside-diphosphate-sugar epimerase [Geodermatophilus dictyosporus]